MRLCAVVCLSGVGLANLHDTSLILLTLPSAAYIPSTTLEIMEFLHSVYMTVEFYSSPITPTCHISGSRRHSWTERKSRRTNHSNYIPRNIRNIRSLRIIYPRNPLSPTLHQCACSALHVEVDKLKCDVHALTSLGVANTFLPPRIQRHHYSSAILWAWAKITNLR